MVSSIKLINLVCELYSLFNVTGNLNCPKGISNWLFKISLQTHSHTRLKELVPKKEIPSL